MNLPPLNRRHLQLDAEHVVDILEVPRVLQTSEPTEYRAFEEIWALRKTRPTLRIHGRAVQVPRWQQAYGRDYAFSQQVSSALSTPPSLVPYLKWSQLTIDRRLNGILVNWYAAPGDEINLGRTTPAGDYIGPHRDSREGLVDGSPIVTISLGGNRMFRLRRYREKTRFIDIPVSDGVVVVLRYDTNLAFTHEIPRPRSSHGEGGRRVSITLRAFR